MFSKIDKISLASKLIIAPTTIRGNTVFKNLQTVKQAERQFLLKKRFFYKGTAPYEKGDYIFKSINFDT